LKEEGVGAVSSCPLHKLLLTKGDLLTTMNSLTFESKSDWDEIQVDVSKAAVVNLLDKFDIIEVKPPTILTVSAQQVSWTPVKGATEYLISLKNGILYKGPNTQFVPQNLKPGILYEIGLSARIGDNWASWNKSIIIQTQ